MLNVQYGRRSTRSSDASVCKDTEQLWTYFRYAGLCSVHFQFNQYKMQDHSFSTVIFSMYVFPFLCVNCPWHWFVVYGSLRQNVGKSGTFNTYIVTVQSNVGLVFLILLPFGLLHVDSEVVTLPPISQTLIQDQILTQWSIWDFISRYTAHKITCGHSTPVLEGSLPLLCLYPLLYIVCDSLWCFIWCTICHDCDGL